MESHSSSKKKVFLSVDSSLCASLQDLSDFSTLLTRALRFEQFVAWKHDPTCVRVYNTKKRMHPLRRLLGDHLRIRWSWLLDSTKWILSLIQVVHHDSDNTMASWGNRSSDSIMLDLRFGESNMSEPEPSCSWSEWEEGRWISSGSRIEICEWLNWGLEQLPSSQDSFLLIFDWALPSLSLGTEFCQVQSACEGEKSNRS